MGDANKDNLEVIDLLSVFNNFIKYINLFFNKLILFFVKFRRLSINYVYLIIGFGVLGGGFGFFNAYKIPDSYTSSILLHSKYFNERLIKSAISNLNILVVSKDYSTLSNLLNVDVSLAKKINSISYETFLTSNQVTEIAIFRENLKSNKELKSFYSKFEELFRAENSENYRIIFVLDEDLSGSFDERIIVNYFKNIPYVKKRLEINNEQIKSQILDLEKEILRLDSLKKMLFTKLGSSLDKNIDGSNNLTFLGGEDKVNPLSVISERRKIYNTKLQLQKILYLNTEFEIMGGVKPFHKVEKEILRTTLKTFFIGIFIAYLLIFILKINSFLNKFENSI
jgi:hypothetical protein